MKFYAIIFAAVTEFAGTIIGFYFLGQWLAERRNSPQLSMFFILIGLTLGLGRVAWAAWKLQKDSNASEGDRAGFPAKDKPKERHGPGE